MKILILGFSSLEYDLVEEFDLKYLKQKEYGKIEIPLNGLLVEPSPVLIWMSFLTGKKPGEFGYDNVVVYRKPIRPILSMYYKTRMKRDYGDIAEKNEDKKTTDYLSRKFLKYHLARLPRKEDINCDTILDMPNRIHFDIPVIDKIFSYNEKAKHALENPDEKLVCEHEWREDFYNQQKRVFDSLKENWELNMAHFYILDVIQHIYFDDKLKIRVYYSYVDRFVQEIGEKLPKDVLMFIVSDNGKKNGLQTNHGFFSVNKRIGLKQNKMTDFKGVIEKLILDDVSQVNLGG